MVTEQIAIRLPVDLLAALDRLVANGVYESRAAAVRAGIEAVADAVERHEIDRAIVDGYKRAPATAADYEAAVASIRDAIADEPW